MPQPLPDDIADNPAVQVYMAGGMAERPTLALAFAEAMEACAVLESAGGLLYLAINDHRPQEAFLELGKTHGYRDRAKMVRKRAKKLEDPIDRALALASLDAGARAEEKREQMSQGIWGYTDALADSVLLRSPQRDLFDLAQQLNLRLGKPAKEARGGDDLLVYRANDFKAVETAASLASATLEMTSSYLVIDDPEEKNSILAQLLSSPITVADFADRIRRS